jgi:lipooligosaccharide transport system permease protein
VSAAVEIAEKNKSSAMYAGRPQVLLERGWLAFRSSNWVPVITGFVEPVLFLLAFGYGMGTLVGDVTTGGTTIDYTLFIAPGLLANSAMNGAIYDSTWNVFWKLNDPSCIRQCFQRRLGPWILHSVRSVGLLFAA